MSRGLKCLELCSVKSSLNIPARRKVEGELLEGILSSIKLNASDQLQNAIDSSSPQGVIHLQTEDNVTIPGISNKTCELFENTAQNYTIAFEQLDEQTVHLHEATENEVYIERTDTKQSAYLKSDVRLTEGNPGTDANNLTYTILDNVQIMPVEQNIQWEVVDQMEGNNFILETTVENSELETLCCTDNTSGSLDPYINTLPYENDDVILTPTENQSQYHAKNHSDGNNTDKILMTNLEPDNQLQEMPQTSNASQEKEPVAALDKTLDTHVVTLEAESGLSKLKIKRINKKYERKKQRKSGIHKKLKPNPCLNKKCQNNCGTVRESDRQLLFEEYYKYNSYDEKKSFLLQCMKVKNLGRKRTKNVESKKTKTVEYGVVIQGEYRRVCQQFLLKTLDISQMTLRQTLDNVSKSGRIKKDCRGRCAPKNKTNNEDVRAAKEFIEKIPVVPSHYCRTKTKKLYMPSDIRNFSNLFRLYKEHCQSILNRTPVGRATFFRIFKAYNLGIHVPKKDKCNHCEKTRIIGEENLNPEDKDKYNRHREEIEKSRVQFKNDQDNLNPNFLCASFDLQKVLTTPHGDSVLLYYARKLAVYNFTVYESGTKKGFFFLWNECLGKKGSNEICTALNMYLNIVDKRTSPEIHELSLYCDNCSGQNKNKQILAMCYRFLKRSVHVKKISINYLIAGHTYMPVDSMHSAIESFISKKTIYAPSMWAAAIRLSRHNPEPYFVHSLNYTDFDDYSDIAKCIPNYTNPKVSEFKEIMELHENIQRKRPTLPRKRKGNKNIEISAKKKSQILKGKALQITKVKVISMEAENPNMVVRYSYLEDLAETETFTVVEDNVKNFKKCYNSMLPISAAKYKDLTKLCSLSVIPQDYHKEYTSLPHSKEVSDTLPDTDEEDEIQD